MLYYGKCSSVVVRLGESDLWRAPASPTGGIGYYIGWIWYFRIRRRCTTVETLHSLRVTWPTLCSSDSLLLLAAITRRACGVAVTVSTRALHNRASKRGWGLRLSTCKKPFMHSQPFYHDSVSRESLGGEMWSDFLIICYIVCDPQDDHRAFRVAISRGIGEHRANTSTR